MQNVEYKAELRDPSLARTIAASIGALRVDTLRQTDTYFRIPDGKLKKRETLGQPTEWVFYSRPGQSRAKLSTFTIYPEHMARERFGSTDLPVWLVVKKCRDLWTWKGVRIHLDSVEGLAHKPDDQGVHGPADFIEFEALICPERTQAQAHEQVEFLRASFAPALGEPIAVGYAELLSQEQEPAQGTAD
ncbi:MAG TPA: class IV adenylate cyclase [Phycisphaerales bacterium]|nr:class IV adenylate cyclase [Phycisphaerales bacterium]